VNTNNERLVVIAFSSKQLIFATFQKDSNGFKDKSELHSKLKKTSYTGELIKLIDADDIEFIWSETSMSKNKALIKEEEVYEQFIEKGYLYVGTRFKAKPKPLIDGFTSSKPPLSDSVQQIEYAYTDKPKLDQSTNIAYLEGAVDSKNISDSNEHDKKRPILKWVGVMLCFVVLFGLLNANSDDVTATRKTPSKPRATVSSDFENTTKAFIVASGYSCSSIDYISEHKFSYGYSVTCNNHRYRYEIVDRGGNWFVSVK
jgi:hypothetical protein